MWANPAGKKNIIWGNVLLHLYTQNVWYISDNNLPKLHTHSNFEHGSSGSLQCQIDKATKGRVSVRKDGAEVAHFIVPDGYPFVIPERYNRYNITYDSVQSAVSLHIMDVQFDQDKGRYTCGQADGKESNPINVVVHSECVVLFYTSVKEEIFLKFEYKTKNICLFKLPRPTLVFTPRP